MRYASVPELDAVYQLVAALYETDDEPERAMTVSNALVSLGEDRSWASVWWAYGAIHYDLSDAAYRRALELLQKVDRPPEARPAALMLTAEIESTWAIETGGSPNPNRQAALLTEAAALAPGWPNLHLRLAYAYSDLGDREAARAHAGIAVKLLEQTPPSADPFDCALSGVSLDRTYVTEALTKRGLLKA